MAGRVTQVIRPGDVFGRLTVTAESAVYQNGKRRRIGICSCSCGARSVSVLVSALAAGDTRSCGCLRREVRAALNQGLPASSVPVSPVPADC